MSEENIRLESAEVTAEREPRIPARVKRRRHVRYAAPLGFLVLLFALIGVISVITAAIGWIGPRYAILPLRI